MDDDGDRYLQPLQVISYFLENGGKATNVELVKNFKTFLTKSAVGQENAAYLKRKAIDKKTSSCLASLFTIC